MEAGGLLIGGLGGVFKGSIWYPREGEDAEATWRTRSEYLKSLRPPERWKKGLPLRQRDTIFPEDAEKVGKLSLDVLVCHEAPLPHRYGFGALNALAGLTGARLLVHGHHQRIKTYTASLPRTCNPWAKRSRAFLRCRRKPRPGHRGRGRGSTT